MAVYVDDMRAPYGRMVMCHMLADTLEELHLMADKIGVARRWFQGAASSPHYDICLAKRAAAVRCGAIEIDRRQVVALIRRLRRQRMPAAPQEHCQNGRADICLAGSTDGICCPPDSCDIDDGTRPAPRRRPGDGASPSGPQKPAPTAPSETD